MTEKLYNQTRAIIADILGTDIFQSGASLPELHGRAIIEVWLHPEKISWENARILRESYLILEKYGYYKDE